MRVAALTMAYNEPVWAPVWARHYASQLGARHCYLLDHGSDDGSTTGLGVTVERLARTALDEDIRAATVGARAAALLEEYDAVIHSDVDELVIADPVRYDGLLAFAAAEGESVVTAAGLDVQHIPAEEPALVAERPIGAQRGWVRFSAAMCKPCFVRRPVRWSPGFHRCDSDMVVSGLYLLHLRYADLSLGLQRLRRTRNQAFAREDTNPHQRVPDVAFEEMVRNIAQLPREAVVLAVGEEPLRGWLARVERGRWDGGAGWLSLAGDRLWALPAAWRTAF